MTPGDTTPLDQSLFDELLAADRSLGDASRLAGMPDESWVSDCLGLLELIRARVEPPIGALGPELPLRFGRFEVLREIGRGGFGVVYLARDPVLERDVALKVPRPEMLVTAQARLRFMREARASAVLDHPNIVPVHEAGELGSVAYIVSAYHAGPSLSAWLKGTHEPVAEHDAARLIATLGRAVQHAHEQGILHRDLKPANVVLQVPRGLTQAAVTLSSLVPRITDFGLAKLVDDDSDLTRSGLPMGSPPYMAPEQAAGRLRELGPATDVYALGATLYELLTGGPPFRGETPSETIRQVIDEDPIAPRVLRPGLSRDLETICLHSLNKNFAHRYPTSAALADDLERFLTGQPITALPPTLGERVVKWARRRPAHAAAVALLTIVIAGAAGGMIWSNAWLRAHNLMLKEQMNRADRHAQEAVHQKRLALEREALADRHLHAAQLRLARQAYDAEEFERAQEVLLDDVYGPGPDHRDFAWRYLWRQCRREVALLGQHSASVRSIDLSPDGRTLASCDAAGVIMLWDTSSQRLRATLRGHAGATEWLAFSPDGTTLASCGEAELGSGGNKEILLWDVASGQLRSRPVGLLRDEIRVMAFLDNGRLLAVVTRDSLGLRTVRVWDLISNAERPRPRYEVAGFGFVMASPDGRFFAVREPDGRLTLRESADGTIRQVVATDVPEASALAVSTDGRLLAATTARDRVCVWDLEGSAAPRVYKDEQPRPDRLIFSPDAKVLVAVTGACQVSIRDLATGSRRILASLDPARAGAFNLAFSPNGDRLALYGNGHPGGVLPLAIWRVATAAREHVFPGRPSFQYISFSADGKRLFLGGNHELSIWKPRTTADDDDMKNQHDEVWTVAFSPDGSILASGCNDHSAKLWDTSTGRERFVLRGHTATVSTLAFHPEGRLIATGSLDRHDNVILWDLTTGRSLKTLSGHTERLRSVAFSPDGALLASAGSDREIRLWDGHTGEPRGILAGHEDVVRQLAFAPDGQTLASVSNDRTIRIWDPRLGRSKTVLRGRYSVSSVAYAPDAVTLATADVSGYITLWDIASAIPRLVINGDDEEVRALAFTADGGTLASAGLSQSTRLWDPVTGQELLTLGNHIDQGNALAFSPDDNTLVSAEHGGFLRFYRGTPDPGSLPDQRE